MGHLLVRHLLVANILQKRHLLVGHLLVANTLQKRHLLVANILQKRHLLLGHLLVHYLTTILYLLMGDEHNVGFGQGRKVNRGSSTLTSFSICLMRHIEKEGVCLLPY